MRSGIVGPLSASGDQAISCHRGEVPNFYNRTGGPCCITGDNMTTITNVVWELIVKDSVPNGMSLILK